MKSSNITFEIISCLDLIRNGEINYSKGGTLKDLNISKFSLYSGNFSYFIIHKSGNFLTNYTLSNASNIFFLVLITNYVLANK